MSPASAPPQDRTTSLISLYQPCTHNSLYRAKFFEERYKTGQLHNRIVKHTTLNFTKREMADEVKAFFEANFNPAERTVQQERQ